MITKQEESVGYLFVLEQKHRNHAAMGPKGGRGGNANPLEGFASRHSIGEGPVGSLQAADSKLKKANKKIEDKLRTQHDSPEGRKSL